MSIDEAVVVALGSNLATAEGAPGDLVLRAMDALDALGLRVTARSSLWRSKAWPDPREPDYLNAVALVETGLEPMAALHALHGLERRFGRAPGLRNASRPLDLDLIGYGRRLLRAPGLTLPHPRAAERRFVMGPLAEVASEWRHPESGERAADLAARATVGRDAHRL